MASIQANSTSTSSTRSNSVHHIPLDSRRWRAQNSHSEFAAAAKLGIPLGTALEQYTRTTTIE